MAGAGVKTFGIIGLGSIGARHAGTLVGLGHHVIGHDVAILGAPPVPIVPLTKLIADADAVIIASPTYLHARHLDQCSSITFGKRHVFIEKPIVGADQNLGNGGTIDALSQLLERRENDKLVTFVGFNLRFHSCVIKARHWIEGGDIGEPLWANLTIAQHSDKPAYKRDGVISNWASHEIDVALLLLGPATVASATARLSNGHDDIADIALIHDNGCRTVIHADYVTKPEIRQTVIVGTKGTIIADLVHRQAWLRDADGEIIEHHAGADSFDENYTDEMVAFIRRLDGHATMGATGADGLAALRIVLDAKKMAAVE